MQIDIRSCFLEGERIYLREVRETDVTQNYYQWMNTKEIVRFTESRFYPNSTEKIKEFVKGVQNNNNVFFAIVDKQSGRHIGNVKLGNINWVHRHGDIGIIIGEKEFWGRGIAAEAIRLVTAYGFNTLNLKRIYAGIYENNTGSIKAFERAGFKQEGVLRKHYYYEGQYIDGLIFGIVNEAS